MEPEDEILLNLVNGKQVTIENLLLLISIGYLIPSEKANQKLWELKGAIHEWNPKMATPTGETNGEVNN